MAEDITFDAGLNIESMEKDLQKVRKLIEKAKEEYNQKSKGLEEDEKILKSMQDEADELREKLAYIRETLDNNGKNGKYLHQKNVEELIAFRSQFTDQLSELETKIDNTIDKNIQLGESLEKDKAELEQAEKFAQKLEKNLEKAKAAASNAGAGSKYLSDAVGRIQERSGGIANNTKKGSDALSAFTRRIGGLVKGALVFSVITSALTRMRSSLVAMIKENEELNASLSDMRNAFKMAAQPIIDTLVPVLNVLIGLATRAALAIANLFAQITGKKLKDFQKATKGVGGGSKRKSMASFDTVQTLGNSGGGGGGGGALDITKYQQKLDELMIYASGALLALGLILALSGANIPLGIALIALGAVGLASEIALNWEGMPESIRNAINNVLPVLAGALLVIGALLTFSGAAIPLGIGLMVAGAVMLGTAIAVNWHSTESPVKTALDLLTKIAAGALLALGVLLTISGANIPLGIALIAAGAITLVSAAAVNSDIISNEIKHVLGVIISIAAGAMIALGLVLICTGAIPIGIALLAAGALSVWTAMQLNTDEMSSKVNTVVKTILRIAGGALIALGLMLVLTGGGIGIGIALIAAGALAIVTTAKIDWDFVTNKIKSILGTLLAIISGASIVVGLLLCLTGIGVPAGLALILAGIAGTYAAVTITDNPIVNFVKGMVNAILKIVNWLISQINKIGFGMPDWVPLVGGKWVGFNIKSIPYLAQGAVIPPNREFLAVLGDQKSGTNIEAPLDTIIQAFRQVMMESGGQEIEVNFTGSMAQFVAMLDKQITISRRNRGK